MSSRPATVPVMAALGFALAACTSAAPGWQTYRDEARGFSVSYPADWKLSPDFADEGYGFYQGEADDKITGLALRPVAELQPGTNLETVQTYMAIETLPPFRKECIADNFIVDPPPDYFTEEPQSTPDYARTVAEPGDLYAYEHLVYVVSKSPCLAAHYYIGYGQMDEERAKLEKPFDRAALLALFDGIRKTVVAGKP